MTLNFLLSLMSSMIMNRPSWFPQESHGGEISIYVGKGEIQSSKSRDVSRPRKLI